VFIHILDPVFLVEMLAHLIAESDLTDQDLIENTVSGIQGISGKGNRQQNNE